MLPLVKIALIATGLLAASHVGSPSAFADGHSAGSPAEEAAWRAEAEGQARSSPRPPSTPLHPTLINLSLNLEPTGPSPQGESSRDAVQLTDLWEALGPGPVPTPAEAPEPAVALTTDKGPVGPTPREAPEPAVALTVPTAPPGPPPYEITDRGQVRRFLERFTGYHRELIGRWLDRSGRYVEMIRAVFRETGLPDDLLFTAMQESGFNPVAVSRAGAKGLWQFMAPTARRYGLRIDHWLDERLDPEKSTVAAARYMRDLYEMFGSWTLVQAAYNGGEMRVARAIKALQTTDFWELTHGRHLADETKDFVASIQALTLIGRDPGRYGFEVNPHAALAYEVVPVPPAMPLKRLAALAGLPAEALEELNPELRRGRTPPGGPYGLKIPIGASGSVKAALSRNAKPALADSRKGQRSLASARASSRAAVGAAGRPSGKTDRSWVSLSDAVRWADAPAPARVGTADRLRAGLMGP
jgi:membrane-bound lytic murein transglycosylase D